MDEQSEGGGSEGGGSDGGAEDVARSMWDLMADSRPAVRTAADSGGDESGGGAERGSIWDLMADTRPSAATSSGQELWDYMADNRPAPAASEGYQVGEYPLQQMYGQLLDGTATAEKQGGRETQYTMAERIRMFNACQEHVGDTDGTGRAPPGAWKKVNKRLGHSETSTAAKTFWKNRDNRVHPYEKKFQKTDISLYTTLELLRNLAEAQSTECPWTRGDDGEPMAVIPSNLHQSYNAWWLDQVKNVDQDKWKWLKAIDTMKRNGDNTEMLQILSKEGKLCLDNSAMRKSFLDHRQTGVDTAGEGSDHIILGSAFMVFYRWAGVKDFSVLEKRKREGLDTYYPGVNSLIDMFRSYKQNPTVTLFDREMGRFSEAQARLVEVGRAQKEKAIGAWDAGRGDCAVHRKEVKERLANGDRCTGGDECLCEELELGLALFLELHHNGPAGRAKKQEIKWESGAKEGTTKQPCEYTQREMDLQREAMVIACRFYHRLVDYTGADFTGRVSAGRRIRAILTRALLLHISEGKCTFSDLAATESNFPAFDSHHLSWSCNIEVDGLILQTSKFSEISEIRKETLSWQDFVENLFPELIITRLIDCRLHRLVHLMINNLSEFEDVHFPYKYDAAKNLLRYTGELDEDEKEQIAIIKKSIKEGEPVELPSAMEVLNAPASGATRRKLARGKRGRKGKKNEDESDGEDEWNEASGSESESELESVSD